jgi:hypothetical protein
MIMYEIELKFEEGKTYIKRSFNVQAIISRYYQNLMNSRKCFCCGIS